MSVGTDQIRDWRRPRLFGPIVSMALAGLVLVVVLSIFLINRFGSASADQERAIVERGIIEQGKELDAVVATQVDWNLAITKLDNKFDPAWADFNLGNYPHTFNGFSHVFVIDGAERPIYAAARGERSSLAGFAPFKSIAAQLIPRIRSAELQRGLIKPRPGKNNILIPPIQTNAFARVDGQIDVVIATLIQPDFGKKLPKGPRAPITIAAKPIGDVMLKAFAQRYLLAALMLATTEFQSPAQQHVVLHALDRTPLAALSWIPAKPGTLLREKIQIPPLAGVLLLALLPNRAMLFEQLRSLLAERQPRGEPLAVICVDLDRFKEVNDTLGHHAGDLLIQAVATRLRRACPDAALIARLGGDAFVILLEVTGPALLDILPGRILAHVSERVGTKYGWLEVGCSLGIAVIDNPGVEPSETLRWADIGLLGRDPQIAANVDALKRLGLSIALDDFGTGYSSLSVLQRFAVDRIKIDRSFVSALRNASASDALVDSMLKLARAMNLSVIAAGVETEAQNEWLVLCGCCGFQGHLTGLPLPADQTAQFLGEAVPPRRKLRQRG